MGEWAQSAAAASHGEVHVPAEGELWRENKATHAPGHLRNWILLAWSSSCRPIQSSV